MKNFFIVFAVSIILSSCALVQKAVCPIVTSDSTVRTEKHEIITVDTIKLPLPKINTDSTKISIDVDSVKFVSPLYLPTIGTVGGRVTKEKGSTKIVVECYTNVDSLKAVNAKLQSYIVTINKQLSIENTKSKTIVVTKTVYKVPWYFYLLLVFFCLILLLVIWLAIKAVSAGAIKLPSFLSKPK